MIIMQLRVSLHPLLYLLSSCPAHPIRYHLYCCYRVICLHALFSFSLFALPPVAYALLYSRSKMFVGGLSWDTNDGATMAQMHLRD